MKNKTYFHIKKENIEYNLIHLPQLIFEVTDACNLRCKYCGYADLYEGYDKRENLKFPFIRAKQIVDYLHNIWSEHFEKDICTPISIGFYGGEPLLNVPFIQQVIEYLENLSPVGKKYHYNMTTNAVLLDKYMDFLVEKQFHILISLDGDENAQSYRIDAHGRNSFERVFKNIKLLQEKYPKYFEQYVMFNSVLHSKNCVEETYHFIKDIFGKVPIISPLNNSGIKSEKLEEFKRTYRNYSESIQQATNCESLKSELFIKTPETDSVLKYLYYISGNVFFRYNGFLLQKKNIQLPPTGTCIPFSKKMFITVKGKILQCEKINHEFSLGQVTDEGVKLDFEAIAKQHNDYVFRYAKQCEKCGNRTACMQCVYQIDDIHDPNTRCHGFCTEAQKEKQNEQCLRYLSEHPELYKRLLNEVTIRG